MLRIEETTDPEWFLKIDTPLLVADEEDYPAPGLPVAIRDALEKLSGNPKWTPGSIKVVQTDARLYVLACTHDRESPPGYSSVSAVLKKIREVRAKLKTSVLATPPLGMGLGSDEINWSVMEDMIKIWFGGAMTSRISSSTDSSSVMVNQAPVDFTLELWKYDED